SQTFVGTDGDDGFGIRIDLDIVPPPVPVGDCLAQAGNPLRHRIAVRIGPVHRLDELVYDMPWRGTIRVAHGHIDDIFAPPARRHLEFPRNIEYIRWEALDTGKRAHGDPSMNRGMTVTTNGW